MKRIALCAVLGSLTAMSASATLTVLDDFVTGGQGVFTFVPPGGVFTDTTAAAGVPGGWRTIGMSAGGTGGLGLNSVMSVNTGAGGFLSLSTSSDVDAVGTVTYDASGAGLGGYSLSGMTAFVVGGITVNDLGFGVKVRLTDTLAGVSTAFLNVPALTLGDVSIPLASFLGSANLGSLSRIDVTLDPPSEGDLKIHNLSVVVPETGTTAVAGAVSLLVLACSRRRSPQL